MLLGVNYEAQVNEYLGHLVSGDCWLHVIVHTKHSFKLVFEEIVLGELLRAIRLINILVTEGRRGLKVFDGRGGLNVADKALSGLLRGNHLYFLGNSLVCVVHSCLLRLSLRLGLAYLRLVGLLSQKEVVLLI